MNGEEAREVEDGGRLDTGPWFTIVTLYRASRGATRQQRRTRDRARTGRTKPKRWPMLGLVT